jgi:hypothetical protein
MLAKTLSEVRVDDFREFCTFPPCEFEQGQIRMYSYAPHNDVSVKDGPHI